MDISIITPSFRQLDWLRLCIASVADQKDVEVEHIVQDAGSPGIEEFADEQSRTRAHLKVVVEKDSGMYDAVNRGLRKAQSDIVAYLNCDEQYLPGVLRKVVDFFKNRPDLDVLLADMIVVDPESISAIGRRSCRASITHWSVPTSPFPLARLFSGEASRKHMDFSLIPRFGMWATPSGSCV